jgi:hypothetical protein
MATGTLNLTSTTSGKVALVSGTTLLTGNCPGDNGTAPFNPLNANVADFAGYGGTAATASHCYEGSGPASFSLSNNTIAVYRKAGGLHGYRPESRGLLYFDTVAAQLEFAGKQL